MKRFALFAFVVLAMTNIGCMFNQYKGDPRVRADQLINQSEDYRQIEGICRRFWHNDMPSHLTPERIDGGIMK